ncbi:uncharacterized protein [Symphalangus syndactylus]|uniref:uncharacterized protein isoform X2 n=1 Tax=Symphalangus syndactylus TaxID=9590 RepID=UPI003005048B
MAIGVRLTAAPPESPPASGARLGRTKEQDSPQQRNVGLRWTRGEPRPAHRVTWLRAEQRIKGALWPRNKEPPRAQGRGAPPPTCSDIATAGLSGSMASHPRKPFRPAARAGTQPPTFVPSTPGL